MKEHEKVTGPSLVICPLSVLYSWCSELEKWAPDLKYLRLHSSCLDERERQKRAFTEKATSYDVVVTTYEMAKVPSLASLWSRMHFNYLVLDEGHKIKNAESLISQGVRHTLREQAHLDWHATPRLLKSGRLPNESNE
jgi:SWI/SNF-related matrix-associated actin-dependent regulator of chromatin subfamily A member 5